MQYVVYNWNGQLLTIVDASAVGVQSDDKRLLSDANNCTLFINANILLDCKMKLN